MAELLGGPTSAATPETSPRIDPAFSLATEMAERAARSVADEPASLGGLIEIRYARDV